MFDKKPKNEPRGTLYDQIFESRVHQSKKLSETIDGTKSHAVTRSLMEAKARKQNNFERLYTNGGTLLEQKNAKKEDSAPTRKINEQASTALELRR